MCQGCATVLPGVVGLPARSHASAPATRWAKTSETLGGPVPWASSTADVEVRVRHCGLKMRGAVTWCMKQQRQVMSPAPSRNVRSVLSSWRSGYWSGPGWHVQGGMIMIEPAAKEKMARQAV